MKNKIQKSQLPSTALNAICPYFTMFPLDVPLNQLRKSEPNVWVLDPFCGRGTTNYAARLLNLPSVGVDSSPIATAISQGKMVDVRPEQIESLCQDILASETTISPPDGEFWRVCFHSETLDSILKIRKSLLNDSESNERKALRALMLGILHGPRNKGLPSYFSNQMPRTYSAKPEYAVRFWTARNLKPDYVDVTSLVSRKARYYFNSMAPSVAHQVILGDSRSLDFCMLGHKFARVVTSPPYLGMRSYVPDQWLRYWFLGGPPSVTYRHPNQMSHPSPDGFAEQLLSINLD